MQVFTIHSIIPCTQSLAMESVRDFLFLFIARIARRIGLSILSYRISWFFRHRKN